MSVSLSIQKTMRGVTYNKAINVGHLPVKLASAFRPWLQHAFCSTYNFVCGSVIKLYP